MRIKRVFITMLLCLAFSANACGTDGPVTDNGTGQETSTGDASDTDTDDDGPFDLTEGENGKPSSDWGRTVCTATSASTPFSPPLS